MDWRVYLAGEDYEFEFLARSFTQDPPVVVGRDEHGTYLTGSPFAAAAAAADALAVGRSILPTVNGIARMISAAFRSVRLADRVSSPSARTVDVYVSDSARAIDELTVSVFSGAELTANATIEAHAVVRHADGTLASDVEESKVSALWAGLNVDSVKARAVREFGLVAEQSWSSLYKAYEVLMLAAGGKAALAQRTGVPLDEIKRFTANSNSQMLSGDAARHASGSRKDDPVAGVSLTEGTAIVVRMLDGWSEGSGKAPRSAG